MHTTTARYQVTITTADQRLATFAPDATAARVLFRLMAEQSADGTAELEHLSGDVDTVAVRIDSGPAHLVLVPPGPVGSLPTCCGAWVSLGDPHELGGGLQVADPRSGDGIPCSLCRTSWHRRITQAELAAA